MADIEGPILRVTAVPGHHRGGVVTSWQAYAEWLEQVVAHAQMTRDGHHEAVIGDGTEYRTLPRRRQRAAQRVTESERRRLRR